MISTFIFVFLFLFTSIIKNKTRLIEKQISNLNIQILLKEKNINETQLDFHYLTSPAIIEKNKDNWISQLSAYWPFKNFFDISDLNNIKNKFSDIKNIDEKKSKNNKNINQKSFYFEDYLETNKKNKLLKKSNNFQDRIYLLFFSLYL